MAGHLTWQGFDIVRSRRAMPDIEHVTLPVDIPRQSAPYRHNGVWTEYGGGSRLRPVTIHAQGHPHVG